MLHEWSFAEPAHNILKRVFYHRRPPITLSLNVMPGAFHGVYTLTLTKGKQIRRNESGQGEHDGIALFDNVWVHNIPKWHLFIHSSFLVRHYTVNTLQRNHGHATLA